MRIDSKVSRKDNIGYDIEAIKFATDKRHL